nr:MAG TPA: hypothetical protein [Caudoviricetes sp.]
MIDCSKTENYFAEKKRMIKRAGIGVCRIKCEDCPLGITNNGMDVLCPEFETLYPEKAIANVQKWSNAHPQKTYLSELLKIFPNIPLSDDGTPKSLCPFELGVTMTEKCNNECVECWNRIIEDGKE